ncbi:hypothetical protein [Modestobacter italicus]|uniref:hypothetical protein n=1 Tax=Modestobacter italicus (strain DSM 44449 / CECT 9708 / BC 501) TaxID=2732864 RepID=UPI001C950D59|nr:hypothetical protein [Modestobacter italicus]
MTNPLDQPMPARGPDPDATLAESSGGRQVGKVTLVLGVLAVLAVGVLAGVLVRGAFGGTDTALAAGPGSGGFAGGGYAAAGGAAGGGGGGFPGAAGDATSGTVSALTDTGFTLTTDDGSTVEVTIAEDTTVTVSATGATSGELADGDTVSVQGTETDGTIAATAVVEGGMGGFRGGQPPTE